jgi:nicotinamidase-related amidase
MNKATAQPGKTLLSSTDHTVILIDFQSQMAFATKSIDPIALRNNAALVANAAKIFNVSTIPTTVAEKTFSGPVFDEIKAAFPKTKFFDRTSMNCWEDKAVNEEVNRIGKGRIVLAMQRMVQAGARPMTSLQYLLELQRDWARADTYGATTDLARTFGGAYGLGIIYANTMFPHKD